MPFVNLSHAKDLVPGLPALPDSALPEVLAGFAGTGSLSGYQVEVAYRQSSSILSFLKDAVLVYDRVVQLSILWNPTPCKEMVKTGRVKL